MTNETIKIGRPYVRPTAYLVEVSIANIRQTFEVYGASEAEAMESAKHRLAAELIGKIKATVKR